ncbi:MAG: Gfo/Idh/MocA family oxidoreductase [Planctomycetes bacterium]|nr:Gfo/Idh/MocA family oxidoreductase [Planctomycetota bacterium]
MSLTELAPLRMGVAGLGRAGSFHIERLGLRDDCRVVATYDDCSAARAPGLSRTTHSRWPDFLADEQVELVLLATPPAVHAEMAIAALAAGKHVIVETPLGLSLFEADAIAAAAERCGRQVYVAQTRRWVDSFRTARTVLESSELGRPVALKFINWQYGLPPRWYEPEASNPPVQTAADWRLHTQSGGGVLWEFGVHQFDQLLQLAGRPAESVYARITPSATAPCDDGFLVLVNFSGGLTAHVEVSRAAAAPLSTGWMIAGDRGSYAAGTQYVPNRAGEVLDLPVATECSLADDFYQQVVANLRTGGPHPVPVAEARQTIALIEAARRSARINQVVPVAH